MHHVDLDVGYGFADIAPDTAVWIIDDILMELNRRDPVRPLRLKADDTGLNRELGIDGPLITGSQVGLLAWLSGRSSGDDLAADGDEVVPDAPYWI